LRFCCRNAPTHHSESCILLREHFGRRSSFRGYIFSSHVRCALSRRRYRFIGHDVMCILWSCCQTRSKHRVSPKSCLWLSGEIATRNRLRCPASPNIYKYDSLRWLASINIYGWVNNAYLGRFQSCSGIFNASTACESHPTLAAPRPACNPLGNALFTGDPRHLRNRRLSMRVSSV
jgi:hypothetical protein